MQKNKLNSYDLTASIHTFSVRSFNEPVIPAFVKTETARTNYMRKTQTWFTTINPNKLNNKDIFAYSEFYAESIKFFNSLQIPDCMFWRTDIRLDSYTDNFKDYYKLNLLLISLFSIELNDKNRQAIGHTLMCSKDFTDISTQNAYWQIKYYDKKFQTRDTDPAKARLEFRYLKAPKNVEHKPHEIKEMWFKKLDSIINHFEELQHLCNKELLKAYQYFCIYNGGVDRKRDLLTKFFSLYANSMSVFTREQLRNFFKLCDVEISKIEERINYICSMTKIEFFSKSDLRQYIEKIKASMDEFFLC